MLIRAYDSTLAPLTQLVVYRLAGIGTLFYGGNFAVRRWRPSAASIRASNSTARTRTSGAGSLPLVQ